MTKRYHPRSLWGLFILVGLLLANSGIAGSAPPEVQTTKAPQASPAVQYRNAAVQRLIDATGGTARVSLSDATGMASFVRLVPGSLPFNLDQLTQEQVAQKALAFLGAYGDAFGISSSSSELLPLEIAADPIGAWRASYSQVYRGVPVFGSLLRIHFNPQGKLVAVNGSFIPRVKLNPTPALSANQAASIALDLVTQQVAEKTQSTPTDLVLGAPTLYIYRSNLANGVPGANYLAYEVEVGNEKNVREFVFVDAHTGGIVGQITGIYAAIHRHIYNGTLSDANLVWQEGDAYPFAGSDATAVNRLIDYAQDIYNLFSSMTNGAYLSWDGHDGTLLSVNNYNPYSGYCPNASWNGTNTNFCSGMNGDDTVGHEWGHAVTQSTHGLIYQWQSGALSESYSDIWGEVIDQLNGAGIDTPNVHRQDGGCTPYDLVPGGSDNSVRWLQGEDDLALNNKAMRDMWNPACLSDPGKVSDSSYQCSTSDQGGVHKNCGVPNHAFALAVDGGTYNGQTITQPGIGLTKAAHIYWRAQNVYQTPTTDFINHADALEQSCTDLTGVSLYQLSTDNPLTSISSEVISSADCSKLHQAILATEMHNKPTQCNFTPLLDANPPALCTGSDVAVSISSSDWEVGLDRWTAGKRAIVNPGTFHTPDWSVVSSLPGGASGKAAFANDDPALGDCGADDESGVIYIESPAIILPSGVSPRLAFDHWVATELAWDGGNVKISVNGGAWTLIQSSAFTFNAYKSSLDNTSSNTNPMKGEPAFTGTNGGENSGSWGQSQVNLTGLANPGDTIRLRFEFGKDGCNGVIGWYVDTVNIYRCAAQAPTSVFVDDSYTASTTGIGLDHFTSIQDGINAAGVGGTVTMAAGTYNESVILNKNITLVLNDNVTLNGSLTIQAGTLTAPSANLSLTGNFIHSGGTFNANGGTLTFNGGATQNLTLDVATTFNNLTISSGTTLSETVSADNATVSGVLNNSGTIRKSQSTPATGTYDFGLADATIQVNNRGATPLTSIRVNRIDSNHPNASGAHLQTGKYWDITPNIGASGFNVTLTMPVKFVPATDGSDKLCRYTAEVGDPNPFECGLASENSGNTSNNTLTRTNVTGFSSWTAGRNTSPTAITVRSFNSHPVTAVYLAPALAAGALLGYAFYRRKQRK